MLSLKSHETFEQLYESGSLKKPVLVYFTADWCGACKRIDWDFLLGEFDIPVYKCDIDENKYTPGFCGIRSIPNFIILTPGETKANVVGPFQSSETAKVAAWIHRSTSG
jgi:thioredoxin-like negative regulator of GroEL